MALVEGRPDVGGRIRGAGRKGFWIAFLMGALRAADAQAQEPLAPEVKTQVQTSCSAASGAAALSMTEAEVVESALQHSLERQVASADVEVARAAMRQLRGWEPLELRAGATPTGELGSSTRDMQLALRLNLPRPLETRAEVAVAGAEVQAAEAEAHAKALEIAAEVRALLLEARVTEAALEAEQARLVAAEARRSWQERYQEEGLTTRAERALAVLACEEVKAEVEALRQQRLGLLETLAGRAGLPAGRRLEVRWTPLREVRSFADARTLEQRAQTEASSVLRARARAAEAQAELRLAGMAQLPHLSFVQLALEGDEGWVAEPTRLLTVGLSIPLTGLGRVHSAEATAKVQREELALEAALSQRAQRLADGARRLEVAWAALSAYEAGPMVLVAELERETQEALAAGTLEQLTAVELSARGAQVKVRRVSLLRSYLEAREAVWLEVGDLGEL